ncbi:hypothetical protein GH714_022374 [Hevea brasiliensis]|uniref:Protein kinase domain-containing protein n=1 Tax=Hevea brasiliensis TaxID=3981 RepID=A0A6A6M4J7_HEVBR|nr:hypothetical protein GH714_022374 [Hevea brasiliensis]
MAKTFEHSAILVFIIILLLVEHSEQLQTSQGQTLLRIQRLLNYPYILNGWNSTTDFCNTDPNSSVTVVCYGDSITQLHIIGNKGSSMLPRNFSIDSFVTTLVSLPDLKVLTLASLGLWGPLPGKIARLSSLEILNMSSNFLYDPIPEDLSSLTSLQTLILDDNMFSGELPHWLGSLPLLAVLSLRKNMFNGSLPSSFSDLENLRVLALSHNYFYGEVPDFSSLTNLQVLDLEDNAFGPQFPQLGNKLVTVVLSKNKFRDGLPAEVSSYYQLQRLDLSHNKFVGPFPQYLLSLPSITYLNVADNKFTGVLFENQSCSADLEFVDVSSNLISGHLPECLHSDSKEKIMYAGNCLATRDQSQHPLSFCRNEALAVGILPQHEKRRRDSKIIALGAIGGIVGGIALVVLIFLAVKKSNARKTVKRPTTRLISENASTGYPSKLLSDARYISQTMKLGALGIPAYRSFSLEELEEATNNFDTATFMGEGSQGQMYKGRLKNGSYVAIRCLKMKRSYSTQNFMYHIELISKLRHRNLVSALGHCFECYLDDSSVSRIFLVFEYVPNGTLRSWISGCPWSSSGGSKDPSSSSRTNQEEKIDVYDFGVMLLEIIVGRPLNHMNEVDVLKDQLQVGITSDDAARRSMVDPAVQRGCPDQSLKTMMEVCVRCLLKNPADRPSVEDVMWNLQFAAQVQDGWRGDSTEGSPVSPSNPPRLHLTEMTVTRRKEEVRILKKTTYTELFLTVYSSLAWVESLYDFPAII